MIQLDTSAIKICKILLENIAENKNPHSSVKFFRKDVVKMTIWLFILKSFYKKKDVLILKILQERLLHLVEFLNLL